MVCLVAAKNAYSACGISRSAAVFEPQNRQKAGQQVQGGAERKRHRQGYGQRPSSFGEEVKLHFLVCSF